MDKFKEGINFNNKINFKESKPFTSINSFSNLIISSTSNEIKTISSDEEDESSSINIKNNLENSNEVTTYLLGKFGNPITCLTSSEINSLVSDEEDNISIYSSFSKFYDNNDDIN